MSQQTTAIEQLVPGQLQTTDSTAAFGSVMVCHISSNLPALIRVRGVPGWTSYVLSEPTQPVYCNGIRCGPEHCLVVGGNTDVSLISRTCAEVVVCRIGARASPWSPIIQRGACSLVGNAAELFRIRAAISSCHGPHHPPADLRDSLAELSAASQTGESASSTDRAMSIERARRYIHANFSGALRIASVCDAAGIRPRSLEYGFQELCGISPVSYIKAVRLNHARQLLLSPSAASRTITAIAMDSGFWHLSQFAADYQKFFGENPSTTRRSRCANSVTRPLNEWRRPACRAPTAC